MTHITEPMDLRCKMISKKDFVRIINKLKDANDLQIKEHELLRKHSDNLDGMNVGSLMIIHEGIVVELLNKIMNLPKIEHIGTELEWWLYETDYGRNVGYNWVEIHGARIVIDSAEKLYDYLVGDGMFNAN